MGMYTELVIGVKIEDNDKVIQTLEYMLDNTGYIPEWDHELFKTERWRYMLRCGSAYFDGHPDSNLVTSYGQYYLNVRCNIKNYHSEIELFLDWLCPYICTYGFIGYMRYEEYEDPTLIYVTDDGIEYRKAFEYGVSEN